MSFLYSVCFFLISLFPLWYSPFLYKLSASLTSDLQFSSGDKCLHSGIMWEDSVGADKIHFNSTQD